MSIRDFTTHFQRVEVCNHDSMGSWESTFITGSWVRKVNAGGCRNFKGEAISEMVKVNEKYMHQIRH